MGREGKIEASLNVEQMQEFLERAMALPSPTLKAIQSLAAEYNIAVSLEGARTFKRNVYDSELAKLSKAQELAMSIAGMQEHGAGNTLAQAAGAIVAQETFDLLIRGDFTPDQLAELSLIVKRLRDSDQKQSLLNAKLKESELKLAELERKQQEAADAIANGVRAGGITPERLKEIERDLRMK